VGKRGFEFRDIATAFHKAKKNKKIKNKNNKHQLYKKGYIYFFAQLMFMYI